MSQHNQPANRRGTSLRDGTAHANDHQAYSRRGFLRTLGLAGAGSLAMAALPATSLYGFPLATALTGGGGTDDRKLVLIRLKGGNDGLNTIVPAYDYGAYQAARPRLAIPPNELIALDGRFSIPQSMQPLHGLWRTDAMRVVNSVGYPDSSLSHFTGADILDSGNANTAENGDGWLARYYTDLNPDYQTNTPTCPPAVKIGGPTSIVFNDMNKVDISANFSSPERLVELGESGQLFNNQLAPDDCYYGDQVTFLRTIANAAFSYTGAITDAYQSSRTDADYTTSLGEQLKLVARLIKGGLGTRLYLVTLDGFDTHVGQAGPHANLLNDLSSAVAAFYQDLAAGDRADQVLSMTYSEFGRRIGENGTGGTDHGEAMPVMLFGPALNGAGVHGQDPDFAGGGVGDNVPFSTDFRSLYATVLEDWLCADSGTVERVLGGSYGRVPDLGFACGTVSSSAPAAPSESGLKHIVHGLGGGRYRLSLTLPAAAAVGLEVFTLSGQRLVLTGPRRFAAGPVELDFSLGAYRLPAVPLAYRATVDGRSYAGKFLTR